MLKRRFPKAGHVLKKDNVNFSLYQPYLAILNELELLYCVRQVNLCDEDVRTMEMAVSLPLSSNCTFKVELIVMTSLRTY